MRSRLARDRGSPAVIGIRPLDRWLCVPAFRRVCPCHYQTSVKASWISVKPLNRVSTLKTCTVVSAEWWKYVSSPRYVSMRRHSICLGTRPEPARACKALAVVRIVERGVRHDFASPWSMYEAPAARVNSNVIHAVRRHSKEQQIAQLKIATRHRVGRALLIRCGARDRKTDALVGIDGQAAAIEALAVGATELVWRANELRREMCNCRPASVAGRGRMRSACAGG